MPNDSIQHTVEPSLTVAAPSDSSHVETTSAARADSAAVGRTMLLPTKQEEETPSAEVKPVNLDSLQQEYLFSSFFSNRIAWHEGEPVHRQGYSGDIVPQQLATDNVVALAVIFCISMTLLTVSRSLRFLSFHLHNLFRVPRTDSALLRETSNEVGYQLFLCFDGIMAIGLYALSVYNAVSSDAEEINMEDYTVAGVVILVTLAYLLIKSLIWFLTQRLLIDKQKRNLARVEALFHTALTGLLFLPIALLHIYFGLGVQWTAISGLTVFLLLKFIELCKMQSLLPKKKKPLRLLLYLCLHEILPLALLASTLAYYATTLKPEQFGQ